MKVKTGLTHRERAVDAIEAASKMEVEDDDDAKALLNPGGILAQGNMPMGGLMKLEGGTKAISDVIEEIEREKPVAVPKKQTKQRPANPPEEASKVMPATKEDLAKAKCKELVKWKSDSTGMVMQLKPYDVGELLCKELEAHAIFVTTKHQELCTLIDNHDVGQDDERYTRIFEELDRIESKYTKQYNAARALVKQLQGGNARPKAAPKKRRNA